MSPATSRPGDSDPLDVVIAAFFDAEAAGLAPCPDAWIARHPDLAAGLADFFETDSRLQHLSRPDGVFPRAFGEYSLLREIGRSRTGVVFLARQPRLRRVVALKMIPDRATSSRGEFLRFRFEAEAIASLNHHWIIAIHDYGQVGGCPYFTMPYVPAGSLADHLGRYREEPRVAARIVADAAQAIHHAHGLGILHRDLKPSNILLLKSSNILLDGDTPLVSDFGLAKAVGTSDDLTKTGEILGTPAYMAPEQALGRSRHATTRTDVYGLGTVLYALLTGRAPFPGPSIVETLDQVRREEPASPRLRACRKRVS